MPNLCDYIEEYLKGLLRRQGEVVLQRSDLADRFQCVPSQINYVLATRFTPSAGYAVESRRGGGGYIRITRLQMDRPLSEMLREHLGSHMSQDEAMGLIERLKEEQIVSEREAALMQAAIQRETLAVDLPMRDVLRANLMRAMLLSIVRA